MHILLQPVKFTSVGLLQLLPGEHNDLVLEEATLSVSDCTIGVTDTDISGQRGRLCLTSKRIIWLEKDPSHADRKRSCSFALRCVAGAQMSTGVMTTIGLAPKLNLLLKLGPDNFPAVSSTRTVKLAVTGERSKVAAFQERLAMLLGRIVQHGGSDLPEVDTAALENMTVMGFDHDRSHYALLCKQNDVGAAIHWLQEHAFESLAQLRSHAQQEARGNDAMDQVQDDLSEHLIMMGFSAEAVQASRDATVSTDIGTRLDWLHTHTSSGGISSRFVGSAGTAWPDPRYPEPQYRDTSEHLRSHPVLFGSFDNVPAAVHMGNPYGWNQHTPPASVPQRATGMEAIVAGQRAKAKKIGQDVESGFRDLQALRESGERLARLAASLSSRTASDSAQVGMESGIAKELVDLGIISPVTKSSAGKQYHEQLSRELASFLQQHLRREKGMMVLHDVFCLFNRARGIELVSPDDLRTAAELFESLSLPIRLRVFPSGVAVVQDQSWSDDAVCSNIVDVLQVNHPDLEDPALGRSLTPTDFALEASVPMAVAMEQLLLAERKGFLCRDDTACGLFFYRNFFPELPA